MTDEDLERWRQALTKEPPHPILGAACEMIDEIIRLRRCVQRLEANDSTWRHQHGSDREAFLEMARQIVHLSEVLAAKGPAR